MWPMRLFALNAPMNAWMPVVADYETTQSSPNDFHINCTGAMPRLSQDSWANVPRASQRLGIFDKARLA